jgi:hypothetical protein
MCAFFMHSNTGVREFIQAEPTEPEFNNADSLSPHMGSSVIVVCVAYSGATSQLLTMDGKRHIGTNKNFGKVSKDDDQIEHLEFLFNSNWVLKKL